MTSRDPNLNAPSNHGNVRPPPDPIGHEAAADDVWNLDDEDVDGVDDEHPPPPPRDHHDDHYDGDVYDDDVIADRPNSAVQRSPSSKTNDVMFVVVGVVVGVVVALSVVVVVCVLKHWRRHHPRSRHARKFANCLSVMHCFPFCSHRCKLHYAVIYSALIQCKQNNV